MYFPCNFSIIIILNRKIILTGRMEFINRNLPMWITEVKEAMPIIGVADNTVFNGGL